MAIHDHFSGVAEDYARFRPDYPGALFDWLAEVAPQPGIAWDCACGSGQATVPLAARFERVAATDASLTQLRGAPRLENAFFSVATAELTPLSASSVDLVAVGQALHWFDLNDFFAEARRVLVPGGIVAAWTYGLPEFDDGAIEAEIENFIGETLGPWWPPEVAHVLDSYVSLAFPLAELDPPPFEMTAEWTLSRFLGFVHSWSGVGRYLAACGDDPVEVLADDLVSRWGPPESQRHIRWRLKIRAGTA